MRYLTLLLLVASVFSGSTAFADGEYIGPAYRFDDDLWCSVYSGDYTYEGTYFVQYSNGKRGHATFKCKLVLTEGEPQIYYAEYDSGNYPLGGFGNPDAMCYTTIELNGEKGMWTAQCFNAWDDGE